MTLHTLLVLVFDLSLERVHDTTTQEGEKGAFHFQYKRARKCCSKFDYIITRLGIVTYDGKNKSENQPKNNQGTAYYPVYYNNKLNIGVLLGFSKLMVLSMGVKIW
jgi:hypothetical protein